MPCCAENVDQHHRPLLRVVYATALSVLVVGAAVVDVEHQRQNCHRRLSQTNFVKYDN